SFHKSGAVLVHPLRCYQAKQADARIAVGSIGSRSVGWLPVLKILHQLIVVRYVLGHLQRKAAWRVSAEIEKADIAKLGTLEGRQILAGFIRQGELATDLCPGRQGRRECLAD